MAGAMAALACNGADDPEAQPAELEPSGAAPALAAVRTPGDRWRPLRSPDAAAIRSNEALAPSASFVFTAAGRQLVVLGERHTKLRRSGSLEFIPLTGGRGVLLQALDEPARRSLTIIGRSGRCEVQNAERVVLAADDGDPAAGRGTPSREHDALRFAACSNPVDDGPLAIALHGQHPAAHWTELDFQRASDTGEQRTWRAALDGSDIAVEERSRGPESCPRALDVRLTDTSGRVRSTHDGFQVEAAIAGAGTPLLVLGRHRTPRALRLVSIGAAGDQIIAEIRADSADTPLEQHLLGALPPDEC